MYILLTGKPPYNGRDENAILEQVKNTPLHIDSNNALNLSSDARNLLEKLLIVDPKNRISATNALAHK